jgi:hypothetical protein
MDPPFLDDLIISLSLLVVVVVVVVVVVSVLSAERDVC